MCDRTFSYCHAGKMYVWSQNKSPSVDVSREINGKRGKPIKLLLHSFLSCGQ